MPGINEKWGQSVKFFTLGCKVNQYETQLMREQLLNSGFQEAPEASPAHTYIINTCTVTQHSDSRSLYFIRRAKKENPQARIVVTGCLAEQDQDKIRATKNATFIITNKNKSQIASLLKGVKRKKDTPVYRIRGFSGHTRAFLKIQDGCNRCCSFCKVPLVRGRSRSRTLWEIVKEAQGLANSGFKEIVLCGICLGSYGLDLKPRKQLIDVIKAVEKIEGLKRIRLSSIEIDDISAALINHLFQSKKLCQHLHIPLQSGDDAILEKMGRRYRSEEFLEKLGKIKEAVADIAITTDVLVGFPGEKEENFYNTVRLVQKILPLKVHIFPYSSRPGTAAAQLSAQKIYPTIVKQRCVCLQEVASECSLVYRRKFLHKKLDLLIEEECPENPHFSVGYTGNYLKVRVLLEACALKNQIVEVRLKEVHRDYCLAQLVCC